jgi:hypothetical protein
MPLYQRSQRFNVTQAYSKQSRQGRPEPLNLFKNTSAASHMQNNFLCQEYSGMFAGFIPSVWITGQKEVCRRESLVFSPLLGQANVINHFTDTK